MQTQNYWKQFENTGRIADYLMYKEYGKENAEEKRTADISDSATPDGAFRKGMEGTSAPGTVMRIY